MSAGPREINTPFRPIPLEVPDGMKPNEFFNSTENLNDLEHNNGLLRNPENLLLYRKALGHSTTFDTSIIYNTSKTVLNPLGRPVRRTQVPVEVKNVWNRMNQIIIDYMLEEFPDPDEALVLAGEASLDATWSLTSPGVPSIRMLHNHFIVFDKKELINASPAEPENPNLTDGGQHSLFQAYMRDVYQDFFTCLELKILKPTDEKSATIGLTGYPQGLPSWEIQGGADALKDSLFWHEYDLILKGFIDFYRTFFTQVSTRNAPIPKETWFPEQVERKLLFNNDFLAAAKKVREQCIVDAKYANAIRWQPAFKQLIYRNDEGKLIVTISQNSIGNAITELLGVVVKRTPDTTAYEQAEPALIERLLEVRHRLVEADLGEGIETAHWGADK
ncbi:MAG: hypothetical protein HON68_04265 [Gammaproteobacteria bacterium]|jgi:hypothetical protein|nr:hypothetical protein [Gammaproteobacteria bacterium]MBT3488462.1 hypothetical protein [Gammaproteobacteria bacterium]MBT3719868.1 hypothetical protein [Gammaproteobacteria bacterium]MBT3846167.1 hypothetical protein [Gammaproteobacteria bacterium]MBT3893185.1 hypothetical protein [Gammaproteobacteria bacterium]